MPTLGNALDFAKYEARNIRGHQLGTAPSTPVTGQLYYNTGDNTLYWWDGSQWVSARGGAAAIPPASTTVLGTIQLAGDLAGTATSPQIAAGVITDADVNATNKDGAVGTASMRTLGTGAQQAAPGNDTRFTDARAPTAHHATHEPGGSDPLNVDTVAATASLRTLGAGAQQAMPGNRTLNAIPLANSTVDVNGQKVVNLLSPTNDLDAANKLYVDNTVQGLDAKQSVKMATTGNVTLSGTAQTIDSTGTFVGDRVLVKNQTTATENGIYVVAAGAWTRSADMDAYAEFPAAYVFVEQGPINADTGWVCTVSQGGTLGSTSIGWVQFSGAGQVVSGAGLTKTGNTLDVGAGAGITVNADTIQVANNGITNAMIADGAIALNTADVTGTLPIANGGTGGANAYNARAFLNTPGMYTATFGPGTSFTIPAGTHGLRLQRGLIVQVQDETTGAIELPDISVAANGDVTVTYGAAVGTNAKRITILG